jgi:hypothetical protein
MEIEISDDILQSATRCQQDFSCLSGQTSHLCKVKYAVGLTVLFIEKPVDDKPCGYQASFGYHLVCNCPVRNEIYRRYKI